MTGVFGEVFKYLREVFVTTLMIDLLLRIHRLIAVDGLVDECPSGMCITSDADNRLILDVLRATLAEHY